MTGGAAAGNSGSSAPLAAPLQLGRYTLHGELAAGGMATVHLGRLMGPAGFARTVAIKRLHAQFAHDPTFVAMFLDEARLAARLRHQNVVPILDVVAQDGELFLVMEYVHGESLSRLVRLQGSAGVEPSIAVGIMVGALHGLHAAHEARGEDGELLGLVHRDVSPQNILLGVDGVARLLDFGIAKAAGRMQTTEEGVLKGKAAYMAPELLLGEPADRRGDVWAASVVLWELLAGRALFVADSPGATVQRVLGLEIPGPGASAQLDAVVLRGLSRDPEARFPTARAMAIALEEVCAPATGRALGEWVELRAGDALVERQGVLRAIESGSDSLGADASARAELAELVTPGPRARTGARGASPTPPTPPSEEATGVVHARGVEPAVLSPPAREEPRVPKRRLGWAALAVLVLAGVALALVAQRASRTPVASHPSARGLGEAGSWRPRATLPPAPAPSDEPRAPTASPSAEVRAIPVGSTPMASSAATTRPLRPPAPRVPSKAPPADCEPPFRIVDGIKVPKRECL